jgi:hypothetical protein
MQLLEDVSLEHHADVFIQNDIDLVNVSNIDRVVEV